MADKGSGYFITIEGGEGAGKSTIIGHIVEYVRSIGRESVTTREPGGIAIAEQIRAVILDIDNKAMDGRTEALLYAAARRQHLVEKVMPALHAGKVVICDRFLDSSLAYQGFARGLGIDEVLAINRFAIDDMMPDLTLYLDIEPEVGLARIHADAGREKNRLDLERLDFHHKVREGYLKLVESYPERIALVDANRTIREVTHSVTAILKRAINPF